MNKLIFRTPKTNISGYDKLIRKTESVLSKNFDLVCLTVDGEKNDLFQSKAAFNKETFNLEELLIGPNIFQKEFLLSERLPDKNNINIMTMWESSVLRNFSVKELNYVASRVLVPSLWNVEIFNNSGVKNVTHFPLFVDDELFTYVPKNNLDKFTFFCGAYTPSFNEDEKRKNIKTVISAFVKAFKNEKNVELIIKATEASKKLLPPHIDTRIKIIYQNLSKDSMKQLFVESDVFVSATKAEGWGFFQIESLATGRPVITVNYGGVKDFCDARNSFFIDYDEELAQGVWGKSGGLWANPKESSLIQQMRYCFEAQDEIRNNWPLYSNSVLPKFSILNYENRLTDFFKKDKL